ncbi:hypothetical protein EG103P3_00096 [Enterococcus phage EG103P3]|nr:hypothetical protein EG103P3_00096 [Enterococcus phage EG103P3]
MLEDGKFKHRFMVKLSDGTVEVFREGDAKAMRANVAAFEQRKPRFLDGYNLDHVIKFWVETPEQQQQREQELLEAARRGMVVIDD